MYHAHPTCSQKFCWQLVWMQKQTYSIYQSQHIRLYNESRKSFAEPQCSSLQKGWLMCMAVLYVKLKIQTVATHCFELCTFTIEKQLQSETNTVKPHLVATSLIRYFVIVARSGKSKRIFHTISLATSSTMPAATF